MPLIGQDNPFSLLAVIMFVVAVSFMLEKTNWGRKASAPLMILLFSLLLGDFAVIPNSAPLYDSIQGLLVPLAIPLLLFRADLRKVFRESGTMLAAFALATVVTVIGALVGASVVDLGSEGHKIVGVLTASYIGGSANFVATAEAVQFADSSLYTSSLAADAIGAVIFLLALMSLPAITLVNKYVPSAYVGKSTFAEVSKEQSGPVLSGQQAMAGAVSAISLSLLLCWLSSVIAPLLPFAGAFILILTVLSLLVANLGRKHVAKLHFDFEIGTVFMYIFFATVGAGANVVNIFAMALPIILFLIVLVAVHIVLLVLIGGKLKLDLAELMVASSACILGPAAAAALAAGQGWRNLVSAGMLVGVLGYAIATFIGIVLSNLLA